MKNPTKPQQINWDEFDKLLVPETPGPEWVSSVDILKRYGIQGGHKYQKLGKLFEVKKFQSPEGKWRNYYKVKK